MANARQQAAQAEKAGWSIAEHTKACGYSKRFYYSLPVEKRPRGFHVTARKYMIVESPREYMERLAAQAAGAAQ